MQEIDQALARFYGPPTTHSCAGGSSASPLPPGPHFPVETPPQASRTPASSGFAWPETVRALEREHGRRFAALADALIEARDNRHMKILLFTSCHRAEGRTTLVLTLARALGRRPGRTLLVDADCSGPMLARQLGIRPRVGLDDVVESDFALGEAIINAPDDHLSLLPLRAPVARPREFLASSAWSRVMAKLRREYDLVLIDGGPLFVGLSAASLPGSIDAAVLVHNLTLTTEKALLRARELLDDGGAPLLGLAQMFC